MTSRGKFGASAKLDAGIGRQFGWKGLGGAAVGVDSVEQLGRAFDEELRRYLAHLDIGRQLATGSIKHTSVNQKQGFCLEKIDFIQSNQIKEHDFN